MKLLILWTEMAPPKLAQLLSQCTVVSCVIENIACMIYCTSMARSLFIFNSYFPLLTKLMLLSKNSVVLLNAEMAPPCSARLLLKLIASTSEGKHNIVLCINCTTPQNLLSCD